MPYDPSKPEDHSPLVSAEMRGQLNGLKALMDAILTVTAAQVDGVNTLNPGDPANVSVSVTGNTLHFTFGIPQGATGSAGADGAPGPPGPIGADGEVNNTQLADAIAGTSANTNAVATLGMAVSPGYDAAQVQAIADKVDALITGLRR